MPKHIKYIRVSTEQQGYEQQEHTIQKYLDTIRYGELVEVQEKVSGTVDFKSRKLKSVLDIAESGDVIIVSELSRIARSVSNLYEFAGRCQEKGVSIVQAKDGMTISSSKNDIVTKTLLFAFGLAAEIEVTSIRQRTKAGLDARRELRRRDGGWRANSGKWCTGFGGRQEGVDYSNASIAAGIAVQQKKESDPKWIAARARATTLRSRGETIAAIVLALNDEGMSTRTGGKWCAVTVGRLLKSL